MTIVKKIIFYNENTNSLYADQEQLIYLGHHPTSSDMQDFEEPSDSEVLKLASLGFDADDLIKLKAIGLIGG